MKRLLLSLSVVALLCAAGSAAFAQSTDDFEKELQAFQKKAGNGGDATIPQSSVPDMESPASAAKGGAAAPANNAPPAGSPLGSPLGNPLGSPLSAGKDQGSSGKPGNNNPLGPAGNLPVGKQMPATANALDMQAPVQTQEQMEATAAAQKKKLNDKVFDNALQTLLPMTPEQIRKTLDAFRISRQAAETPITEPVPKVEVVTVSLDPTQVPPVIKTSPGRVSTVIILDSTGSPWPIQDVSWAGKFEVTPPEEGGHVVRITPQSAHNEGNMSVRLVDLITPITFTLKTGLDEVDYRFDARIPKLGPLAKVPLIENGGLKSVVGGDENLVQMLDGTPPASSEKLKIDGTDGRTSVWRLSGRIYLRTPLTLLSPAWSSSVTSGDGMNVYVLNDTPVILLSDEGRVVRAHIAASEVTP
jgi:intracellular multiplication protein IcmK